MTSGQSGNEWYLQLIQQLVELQHENNELCTGREMSNCSCMKKTDRPLIKYSYTDGDWALFNNSWSQYKQMCGLKEPVEIHNELTTPCSSKVNGLLFDLVGSEAHNTATEEQLLWHIRLIAVKVLHKEVHRHRFYNTRLQSQARFCEFTIQCPNVSCQCFINYSEDMVAGQHVAGLMNKEYQHKILAEANTLITVEQKFHRLASIETTDTSTPHLAHWGQSRSGLIHQEHNITSHVIGLERQHILTGWRDGGTVQRECFSAETVGLPGTYKRSRVVRTMKSTSSLTERQSKILASREKCSWAPEGWRWGLPAVPHLT